MQTLRQLCSRDCSGLFRNRAKPDRPNFGQEYPPLRLNCEVPCWFLRNTAATTASAALSKICPARNSVLFEIEITALNCLTRDKCEIVGHTSEVVWVDVPPQQVRGITSTVQLPNMPQLRGKLSPTFVVTRVYAGDF